MVYCIAGFSNGSCNFSADRADQTILDSSVVHGKYLVSMYCQSCHLLPDPLMLDKKTWLNGVLPGMGPRLGIFEFNGQEYPSKISDVHIGRNFYPSAPLVSEQQWRDILNYFQREAPDSLKKIKRKEAVKNGSSFFEIETPSKKLPFASTIFTQFTRTSSESQILVSNTYPPNVFVYDMSLTVTDSLATRGPVVDINFQSGLPVACNIGYLNPTDSRQGSIEELNLIRSQKDGRKINRLLDSLMRPVQVIPVDLNQDKKADYLVCEFGNNFGALTWFEKTKSGGFDKHVLRSAPGAIKAIVQDMNHDGLPDIWCLFTQGDECIILFTNKGHGNFEERKVLRFPAVYGSTYFELNDFNQDGFPDILYTCGDNADYSPILKPYHGIYIFLNDGNYNFKKTYFFPMYGCFKAMARDFDKDGDLDIAAISFFSDASHPGEKFLYLQNAGGMQFHAFDLAGTEEGRWLTMDAGNFFVAGTMDIVLGNFDYGYSGSGSNANKMHSPPFIVLKNKMIK